MTEWIPGLLLGLGLTVLLSGDSGSALVRRLAPHIRDVAPVVTGEVRGNPMVRVLGVLIRLAPVSRTKGTRRSRRAVDDELPAVLDLLGLCVSAGLPIPASFERIGARGTGLLAEECRRISAEIELGVSVADALRSSDERVRHDGWSRVVEHLVSARRQGTPLADIVRFLADDEAQAEGRRLIESASARETMMMFPLVFGILPATVLIAVFPGATAIGVLV